MTASWGSSLSEPGPSRSPRTGTDLAWGTDKALRRTLGALGAQGTTGPAAREAVNPKGRQTSPKGSLLAQDTPAETDF